MKYVSNNTPRVIYGHYKLDNTIATFRFQPGLNEVPNTTLVLLLKEPGVLQLFDDNTLSGSKGDIDQAKDVAAMQAAGLDTQTAPKPIAPPNSTDAGAPSGKSMDEAINKAKAKKTGKKNKNKTAA